MPNNFTNIAICSPGYEFSVEKFNEQVEKNGLNLCEKVLPMPKELRSTDSPSRASDDVKKSLIEQYGFCDWHGWANANWGTKWDTYSVKSFNLDGDGSPILIKFQTAWCAPIILDKIKDWLCRIYEFENVMFVGFDPWDNSTKILDQEYFYSVKGR